MEPICMKHEVKLAELDTQINGVNGKGGIMEKLKSIDDKQDKQTEQLDSINRKLALATGIIICAQFFFNSWGKTLVARAFQEVTKIITHTEEGINIETANAFNLKK